MKVEKHQRNKIRIWMVLSLCVGFSIIGCSQPSLDAKRRATMLEVLNAIKVNDTITIAQLVDTASFFRVYGKENYYGSIKRLYKKFSQNQIYTNLNSNSFSLSEARPFGTTYQIVLFTTPDKKKYYELTMRFIGDSFDKVDSFTSYFHSDSPRIIIQAPSSN